MVLLMIWLTRYQRWSRSSKNELGRMIWQDVPAKPQTYYARLSKHQKRLNTTPKPIGRTICQIYCRSNIRVLVQQNLTMYNLYGSRYSFVSKHYCFRFVVGECFSLWYRLWIDLIFLYFIRPLILLCGIFVSSLAICFLAFAKIYYL